MPSVLVLGAGMVGSVMAADLAMDCDVTIADARPGALAAAAKRAGAMAGARRVVTREADLSSAAALRELVKPFDLVCGALSSKIGFQTLRTVIEAGKNYCDISFFAEDALELDGLAKQHGVTAVVDCGVAPGMSNMITGAEVARLERAGGRAESVAIYVGGLPRERRWPFQYKAGFAPSDVIEEYTRPVRLVEGGRVVMKEALTEPEWLDFAQLGTLEAVNTDGLRSLAVTLKVPNMKEKTLRYPGHYDLMRVFQHTGLFSEEAIEVRGEDGQMRKVRPRDVTAAVMFPKWTYGPGEEDLTVMRIIVEGVDGSGSRAGAAWTLLDFYDRASGATSMSRTTALPCTAVARMILAGRIAERGVLPPEMLGAKAGVLEEVVAVMKGKGIGYSRREAGAGVEGRDT
jgi:saccharopine dehydrogenase-like NADP-dependent oxidoreductase